MRVCHIINNLEVGGAETMLLKLLRSLGENGIDSTVIALIGKGTVGPQIEQLGVRVDCLGMVRSYANLLSTARLAMLLRRHRPDVVNTWMYQSDLLGGLATKLMSPRTPVVWNLRTSLQPGARTGRTTRLTRRACASLSHHLPAAILCNSEAVRTVHQQLGYAREKMSVIPNGFDLEAFRPSIEHRRDVRRELRLPENTPLIGMMARFHPAKDHAMFLAAAAVIAAQRTDVHFVLCGADVTPDNPALAALLREIPERHRFHLLGCRSDMPRLQAALDIGVLASVTWEGFPNAIGEAMACGVPCVVTDTGGSPEVVGDCGRVVPAGDARRLADECLSLLSQSDSQRRELGLLARRRVEEHYSMNAIAARYLSLWHEVTARSPQIASARAA